MQVLYKDYPTKDSAFYAIRKQVTDFYTIELSGIAWSVRKLILKLQLLKFKMDIPTIFSLL